MNATRRGCLVGVTLLAGQAAAATPLPPPRPPDLWEAPPAPLPPRRPPDPTTTPSPTLPQAARSEVYGPVRPPAFIAPTAPPAAGDAASSAADGSPLPPPRPRDLGSPPQPAAAPPAPAPPGAVATPSPVVSPGAPATADDEHLACTRLFASHIVVARAVPPVAPTSEGCAMAAPVEVSGVIVSPARTVAFEPPVTMDCALAAAVADWVRQDLSPAFVAPAAPLAAVTGASGYACRPRNHVAGAKLSEHAHGNAMDMGGLRAADGTRIDVKQAGSPLLTLLKTTACARFATVLGPGSDGFHESHLHVDLEPRRNGAKICQWDLP